MKHFLLCALLATSIGAHGQPNNPPPAFYPVGFVVLSAISQIRLDKDGFATVYFAQHIWAPPDTCRQADMDKALAFDSKTDAGKNLLAFMTDAKMNGYDVTAEGTGTCIVINGKTIEMLNFAVTT